MTPNDRKMRAMRAVRASALRQACSTETKDYEARASQAARMTVLSLTDTIRRDKLARLKVAAMEATARAEGNNACCSICNAYFNQDMFFTCPHCESQWHRYI